MIRDPKPLRELEDRLAAGVDMESTTNRRVFAELWGHAMRLGILPPADPLDGIEVDLRLAEALNVRRTPRADGRRAVSGQRPAFFPAT